MTDSKTTESKDHYRSFNGWMDVSRVSEPKGTHLLGKFVLAQNGLGNFAGTQVNYSPEDLVKFLDPEFRKSHGSSFTEHDLGMLRSAFVQSLTKPMDEERRAALKTAWAALQPSKTSASPAVVSIPVEMATPVAFAVPVKTAPATSHEAPTQVM